jgi:hypothetical protein
MLSGALVNQFQLFAVAIPGNRARSQQAATKQAAASVGLSSRLFRFRGFARSTVRGIQNAHNIPCDVLLHAAMDPVDQHLPKAVNRVFLGTRRRKSENVVVMVHDDDQAKTSHNFE